MLSDLAKSILAAASKPENTVPKTIKATMELPKRELAPWEAHQVEDTIEVLSNYYGEAIERRDAEARARNQARHS